MRDDGGESKDEAGNARDGEHGEKRGRATTTDNETRPSKQGKTKHEKKTRTAGKTKANERKRSERHDTIRSKQITAPPATANRSPVRTSHAPGAGDNLSKQVEKSQEEGVGRKERGKREKHDIGMRRSSKERRSNEQEYRRNDDHATNHEHAGNRRAHGILIG